MQLSPVCVSVIAIALPLGLSLPASGQTSENNINPPATQPPGSSPNPAPKVSEPQVPIAEILVKTSLGVESQELQNQVYGVVRTKAGRTTTKSQLQEDINAILATGYFSNVSVLPEDTPLGVRITFVVQPNPILRSVQVQANVGTGVKSVLPANVVNDIF